MTTINRTVIVPHSANALYNLVLDVGAYPEFLPWCDGARVDEQSEHHQVATVKIAKGPLNTEFTTRNALTADEKIGVRLERGPFRRLEGLWQFHDLSEDACKVELKMDFDFAAGPMSLLLKPVFIHICSTLLNAFVERAAALQSENEN